MVFELTANETERQCFNDWRERKPLYDFICSSQEKLFPEMTDQSRDTRASFLARVVSEQRQRVSLEEFMESWDDRADAVLNR